MKSIEIGYRHPVVQNYLKVKKGMNRNLMAVEGIWAYEKLIATQLKIETLIYCKDLLKNKFHEQVFQTLSRQAKESYSVSEKTLSRIYEKSNLGGLVFTVKKENQMNRFNKLLILDGLENPGNIGTILRSCDGASFDGVLIVNEKTKISQYKVIKASMGGAFTIPWLHFENVRECHHFIQEHGLDLVLAHPGCKSDSRIHKKMALVIGNERYGLSKEWFSFQHTTMSLPMLGCCDSLNAGVAASILIYKAIGSA